MKKFYRRGESCGLGSKIYESCIEIYEQKGEVCDLGDEIYKPSGDICKFSDEIYKPRGRARDFGDEICGPIGATHKRIRERSCGAKAAGGDV